MATCKADDVLLGELGLAVNLQGRGGPFLVVDEGIYHHLNATSVVIKRPEVLKFLVGQHSRQQIVAEFATPQL